VTPIHPEFAVEPQMCDGCDAETPSAVWFVVATGVHTVVLCPLCTHELGLASFRHPVRVEARRSRFLAPPLVGADP
jgi:hypothetical protein